MAELAAALLRLGQEAAKFVEDLDRNNADKDSLAVTAATNIAAMAGAHTPRPRRDVVDQLRTHKSALEPLEKEIETLAPADRGHFDALLAGGLAILRVRLERALDAAAAAMPGEPPPPPVHRTPIDRNARVKIQAFLVSLDEFQEMVKTVARENDTSPSYIQRGELVTFYVRNMELEIDLARLTLRVNDRVLDVGALAGGIERIRGATDLFYRNVEGWTGRLARNLISGKIRLRDGVKVLVRGVRALGGIIDDSPDDTTLDTGRVPDHSPVWADASGFDRYGQWASFSIEAGPGNPPVTQRLRWIPPGGFRIGSPEGEEGRYGNEDDGIDIAFAQGFWMFDTPVTRALWAAVMPRRPDPSRFKGDPARPVETVSFTDAGEFIAALNRLKPGLNLSLPSEAQWEYACRAGTTGATWAGPALVDGKDNAAVLDRIAWWSGNSGGETHPAGQKEANPWGLHDMLGNVWEWCADVRHGSHEGARRDGAPRAGGGSDADRVLRGGSWILGARDVRSAGRGFSGPSDRDGDIGFRCARVQ